MKAVGHIQGGKAGLTGMKQIGGVVKERIEHIIVENEMLRAGFAALPYLVLRDGQLSLGARLSYAVLLSYAWQQGEAFAGQLKMAQDMGISERHLRRFLQELEQHKYIRIKRRGLNKPNIYYILDVRSKLRAKKRGGPDTSVRSGADARVRT